MEDARIVLKRCVARVCAATGTQFARFASVAGFNDFLLDTFDVPRTPKEVAVRALDQLCEGDRKLNDQIVCLAVIAFLDEMLGSPKEDPERYRRLKDLADVVAAAATSGEIERWVENWYE